MELEFETYHEVRKITERRDGCTFRTQSLGHAWFPDDVIKGNRPEITNLVYCPPSDDTMQTIRLARPRTADSIVTDITQAPCEEIALALLSRTPPAMLAEIADLLYIEADGHATPWIRKAIVSEARS